MVDPLTAARLSHWIIYCALALCYVLLRLLPLGNGVSSWPGPQIMLAVSFAWVIRRPDYVPMLLVGLVALLLDLTLMRPPGLMAALVVIAVEFLRNRQGASREWPFIVEMAVMAVLLVAILAVNRLILMIFLVPQPALGGELQQLISTLLAYPIVVLISVRLLGIDNNSPDGTKWGLNA